MHYPTVCSMVFLHYGENVQKQKLIEECAELIRAIAREDEENMLEEMADVLFLLEQFQTVLEYSDRIQEIKEQKAQRTLDRIKAQSVQLC